MALLDGDAHPAAMAELEAICRHPDSGFPKACGALIQKRHEALKRGKLYDNFFCHIEDGKKFYEINQLSGNVGITSMFTIQDDHLILLAMVEFDNA